MSNDQKRKSIQLDLQLCYSGFQLNELQYIDYTRTTAESEEQSVELYQENKSEDKGIESIQEEDEGDGILSEVDFENCSNYSTEEFHSYLCSTPNGGRRHRGYFSQDSVLSGFNMLDSSTNQPSTSQDSGMQTQSRRRFRRDSVVSFYGEVAHADSVEDLHSPGSSTHNSSVIENSRRKIELDSDVHNPYSNVDDFELSIEEELSHFSQDTSKLSTLKRRLSVKLRRNISSGLFGSYLQRTPALPSAQSASTEQLLMSTEGVPVLNKRTGPINLWFRKFRNRHFI